MAQTTASREPFPSRLWTVVLAAIGVAGTALAVVLADHRPAIGSLRNGVAS
ncbi:MAG: hypothetical protein QM611_09330 [Microbacterium sp.]|uniref:hypothetical protein n=1 Tax=Microbacterium sp. TaxID=51671 RepID=UPI0039E37E57